MSEQDSFINEVSEEVRKDRLFGLFRRYGWMAISLIVVLVAGASINEWRKSQARTLAELRGDAIQSAIQTGSGAELSEILAGIDAEGDTRALVDLMRAAGLADEDPAAALTLLDAIAGDSTHDRLYRDLAVLKSTMLDGDVLSAEARGDRLVPLSVPGAPFRPLAMEQMAIAFAEVGDTEAALSILQELVADGASTQGLRRRASQLIVALGGTLAAS
jgi:hypothetical protein